MFAQPSLFLGGQRDGLCAVGKFSMIIRGVTENANQADHEDESRSSEHKALSVCFTRFNRSKGD
jgi:hypothetical protein